MVKTSAQLIDKTRRHIALSYQIALSLVAVMTVLIALLTGHLVNQAAVNTPFVMMAAKQRMWSQRIAYLTTLLAQPALDNRQENLQSLRDAAQEMEVTHQRLIKDIQTENEAPERMQELRNIYFNSPSSLDFIVVSYLQHVRRILALSPSQLTLTQPDVLAVLSIARDRILPSLETAVGHYVEANDRRLAELNHIVIFLSGLSLFILAAVCLLLMRPAVAYIAQAQQHLRELNRMKSDFLANMSHEIRTPMNGIFGMAELLLDSGLNQRQQHYARTLQNSADHLLGLINDILDFSKLEAGHMKLDPIHFNLLATIEDVLEILSARAREKNLELLLHYMPGMPRFIVADPGRIRQVLFNLIGNAIKFTDKGYIIVHVEMKNAGVKTPHLCLRVEDTGIGIPEDKMSALFEKFMQVESGNTRARQGTGLGLAISRNLVELMGGTIDVSSKPGLGSTFAIEMPLPATPEAQPEKLRHNELIGRRALLVDDLSPNRLYFKEALNAAGLECLVAENAHEAMSILAYEYQNKRRLDVILTDYMMPEINGLDFIHLVKKEAYLASIPIIVLTSVVGRNLVKSFDQAGAQASLDKPLSRQHLLDTLAIVVDAAAKGEKMPIITSASSTAISADRLLSDDKSLAGTMILLAEDNRVNLEITTEILTQFGCQVVSAENGKEAIEAACLHNFDLIFMDCQMPEMDGFEAAGHIVSLKAAGKIGPVPIIALTANALKGDRERCLESGMDDYLSKPVRRANLKAVLLKWLRDKLDAQEVLQKDDAIISVEPPAFASFPERTPLPPSSWPDSVDSEAFAEARDLLEGKLATVLGYYIHDAEMYLNLIAGAVEKHDPRAAIHPAHTLKSSSRQFGATLLADLAERMETVARCKGDDRTVDDLAVLMNPMRDAFAQVRPFYQSVMGE